MKKNDYIQYLKARKELREKLGTYDVISYTFITHSSNPKNDGKKLYLNHYKCAYWNMRGRLRKCCRGVAKSTGTLWYEVIDNKTNELVEIIK